MSKDEEKPVIYGSDSIVSLEDIEHIQLRPSMYIGEIYEPGLYKLDSEPILNSVDEYLNGFGTQILITLDTHKNIMVIRDFGRGIPVEKLVEVFTKTNTGGKFNNNSYSRRIGANGVGLKALTALSDFLEVEVYQEAVPEAKIPAKYGKAEFVDGKLASYDWKELPNGIPSDKHRGTKISYISSEKYLKTRTHDIPKLCDYMDTMAYQNSGLEFVFTIDGKTKRFLHTGGIQEHFANFTKKRKLKIMFEPILVSGEEEMFDYEIVFSYSPNNSAGDRNIVSHCNGNSTPEHGYHVSAMRAGAALALTQYINTAGNIPKSAEKMKLSGTLIGNNLVAIVGIGHENPLFDGQTKDSLKSQDVTEPIKQGVRAQMTKWLNDNPQKAKKLVDLVITFAKYNEEIKKLRSNIVDAKATRSVFEAGSIDPEKYTTCRSNDPEEKELFIVEGKSAGGGVAMATDRNFQAIYRLTGKILNVYGKNKAIIDNQVLKDIVQILGMGWPDPTKANQTNYKNLKFNKIIILTDADDDGFHIRILLLTFFYCFYPDIILNGHVYVANPPIKRLTMNNGQYFYISTDKHYDEYMKELILHSFTLHSKKNDVQLSKKLFGVFIDAVSGYQVLIDNHAAATALKPDLLEHIVMNIDTVLKSTDDPSNSINKEFYKRSGYMITRHKNNNIITFDRGIYHASLKYDKTFVDEHFTPILEKLNDIHIYGVYLKGIRSGHDYRGTIYDLCKTMNGILGPKIKVTRFKGLGEMERKDLKETVINPETREWTMITMEDADRAEKALEVFMGSDNNKLKQLFYAGEIDGV